MSHSLPTLPYPHNALEPHIDARTMEIHHGKHHNAYVTNLNTALDGNAELQKLSIEALVSKLDAVPEPIRAVVRPYFLAAAKRAPTTSHATTFQNASM